LAEEEETSSLPVDLLGGEDEIKVPRLELPAYPRIYFYNLVRPHYGKGMEGRPPFQKLLELGYELPEEFALFVPPDHLG